MSDERLTELWRERAHAPLRESLPLKHEGGDAWLARSDDVTFVIVDADERNRARFTDVRDASLRFAKRVLGGELVTGSSSLQIPAGRVDDAKRLIALGRASVPGTRAYVQEREGRFQERIGDVAARVLGAFLDEEEVLLAWLETATEAEVSSTLGAERAPLFLLVTDRRQALVAMTSLGDSLVRPLPASAATQERAFGRDVFRCGDVEWQAPLLSAAQHAELASLFELSANARVLEVARLSLQGRGKKSDGVAEALLSSLVERDDPYGVLTASFLGERLSLSDVPREDRRRAALRQLVTDESSSAAVFLWWRKHKLPLEAGLELLGGLFADAAAREWSVELHTGLREAQLESTDDLFELAAVDIAYAEHLVATRRFEEAQIVLEARLASLPNEELLDLLPPEDADLTAGAGGQRLRIRVLELLADARGLGERKDLATVRALAQLQPLVPSRVEALAALADDPVRGVARQVIAVLAPGGLAPLDDNAPLSPDDEVFPLRKKALYERVQHPAAREGHTLDKLQAFLATVDAPDHAALRSYSERLGTEHEAARAALADASLALGMKAVGAYISRGDKAVGIRSYDGTHPFLVIGGRHLEPSSDFFLHPWELRFSIGSEVAHLRFRHARVTSRDVWKGALEKGRLSVDLVLGMIPVLKGVDVIDKVGKIIDQYKKGPIGRVMKGLDIAERTVTRTRKAPKKTTPAKEQMVAATNDKLIAAHRVMQLTADRAGLVLAGDLGAALRAIFKSTHEYLAELPVVERHGLAKALSVRDDEGEILHQDLAVRASSLISFFLSDDYRALREKLTTPPDNKPAAETS